MLGSALQYCGVMDRTVWRAITADGSIWIGWARTATEYMREAQEPYRVKECLERSQFVVRVFACVCVCVWVYVLFVILLLMFFG